MKEQPIINIDVAKTIIATMKPEFDSHDFLTIYIVTNITSYLMLLKRFGSVETTHQQIGQYLLNNSTSLGISKQGETESENIFGKINTCGLWKRN